MIRLVLFVAILIALPLAAADKRKLILDPDTATKRKAKTPPENTEREIWIYDSIDPEAMAKAYWAAVE